jgi:bacteriorhodopsin
MPEAVERKTLTECFRDLGGNVIAPDSEAVFYGVLDFLAKPVFGALLIWGHRGINPARLGLAIKDYDGDALIHEKPRSVCHLSLHV